MTTTPFPTFAERVTFWVTIMETAEAGSDAWTQAEHHLASMTAPTGPEGADVRRGVPAAVRAQALRACAEAGADLSHAADLPIY